MQDLTRRQALASGAAAIAATYLPMFSAQAAPLTYTLAPRKIGDGIWMLAGVQEAITFENGGAIANITILDSKDGAIVIDTGPSKRFGEQLAAVARELTGKDVARVYLTHFHPDHIFGNQAFAAETIAAPQGVIDGIKDMGNAFSDAMYYIARDWMRGTDIVLPTKAIASGVEDIGGRKLHLITRSGHTPSDLAILDETSGTLITGDLAFLDRAPTTPHANLSKWQETLQSTGRISTSRLWCQDMAPRRAPSGLSRKRESGSARSPASSRGLTNAVSTCWRPQRNRCHPHSKKSASPATSSSAP